MAKILPIIFVAFFTFAFLHSPANAIYNSPQITFGDILALQGQPLQTSSQQAKYEQIQKFLKIIEENGKKSMAKFYGNSPTPGANLSLADNVAGYFITPVPTLNPKLEHLLAQINNSNSAIPDISPENVGAGDLTPLKSSYTIAILGDSMTDTMGENLPHLNTLLKNEFPKHNFVLFNYGQGSTNIEDGLYRLKNPTKYLNRDFPPLLHLQPDIIIIESFAYNHWGAELNDLNRQWMTTLNILDTIKNYSKDIKIVLLATISPNPLIFGDGVLNWPEHLKWDSAITTKAYLQNFINLAASAYLPLADAYNPSLNGQGHGDPKYINPSDHLHPSEEGKLLISQKIVETIKANNLIK